MLSKITNRINKIFNRLLGHLRESLPELKVEDNEDISADNMTENNSPYDKISFK